MGEEGKGRRDQMTLESIVGPDHEGLLKATAQLHFGRTGMKKAKLIMDAQVKSKVRTQKTQLFYWVSTSIQVY